ncbi:MAG TPA: phosphate-starvation-inducible PsiE family protein [Nitrospira sp.]
MSSTGPDHPRNPRMNRQVKERPLTWGELRHEWDVLSVYQRFEALIAFVLTFVIGAVIVVALYRLIISVVEVLVLKSLNPLEHSIFQQVFGEIMTLLIALEFNHTLHHVITGERGIIHTRMVILIAQLALARKIIVTNLFEAPPASTLALAFLMLALGVTYWLMREREDRTASEAIEP